jgi:co-chaperonin GroES (HSP10)
MSTPNEVLATTPAPESTARDFYELKARGKWVLIRMIPRKERRTAGGLVLTMGQEKTQHGEVVDVSSEIYDLQAGDTVVFTNFVTELTEVEELTGERNLYLVRDEEVYSRAVKITDPEVLAMLSARANARYEDIDRQYAEEKRKAEENA